MDRGSLEGTIRDPTGAAVVGARVSVRNRERPITSSTSSDGSGRFLFPVLSVGTYELEVRQPGFAVFTRTNITISVGSQVVADAALTILHYETTVVRGDPPSLENARTQQSTTITERQISSLPVNGRSFLDFVLLTPGVTTDVRGGVSFAGQRFMNSLFVDGLDDNNTHFGQPVGSVGFAARAPYQFSQETVAEFQVNRNSYSAEFGRSGAGVVNVVTKSGGNDLHGTAFWYYRDRSMNATDLISKLNDQPKAPFHFNQFGGSAGGPLRRDRIFFFLAYDAQRSLSQNVTALNLPPNFVVTTPYEQTALAYLSARAGSWSRTLDQNVYFAKLDAVLSSSHLLTVHWNRQRFVGKNLESTGLQHSFEHTGESDVNTDAGALRLTSTLSRSVINVASFGFVRDSEPGVPNSEDPEANVFQRGQLVLSVGRLANDPHSSRVNRLQWQDALSVLRGKHSLKVGIDIADDRNTLFNTLDLSGSFRFNSLDGFGRSLAGAPMDPGDTYVEAFSGSPAHGITVHPDFTAIGAFVQDTWRARTGLTVDLGLRYDVQRIAQPGVENPSPALAASGFSTNIAPTGSLDLEPRIGLAWSPMARMVVRAGYGIYYAYTPSIETSRVDYQNGVTVQTRTFLAGNPIIPAYPNTVCGPPDPSGLSPDCAAPPGNSRPLLILFPPQHGDPMVQQASLNMEYAVARDTAISLAYLFVKGTHLARTMDVNLSPPATASIGVAGANTVLHYLQFPSVRPIAGFDRIWALETNANSQYHALVLQLTRRFSRNWQLLASYTFSKGIDDAPEPNVTNPGTLDDARALSNPLDPRADRSVGSDDQRHRFVLSGIWDLNYFHHRSRLPYALCAGWQLSGILTAAAGQPYSAFVSFDLNNDGNNLNDRTPGTARNAHVLPATISLDPRVTRSIPINDRVGLQLLWEAFNVLNRSSISAVSTVQFGRSLQASVCQAAGTPCLVPVPTFAVPSSTLGPRIMQVSAKVSF